jgi:hypothetical protein
MDSLNSYRNMDVISARTAEELADMIRTIPVPLAIISIGYGNGRWCAFINAGDVKFKRIKKSKEITNG